MLLRAKGERRAKAGRNGVDKVRDVFRYAYGFFLFDIPFNLSLLPCLLFFWFLGRGSEAPHLKLVNEKTKKRAGYVDMMGDVSHLFFYPLCLHLIYTLLLFPVPSYSPCWSYGSARKTCE